MKPLMFLSLLAWLSPAFADTVRVAVAANFHATAQAIATQFQTRTGHRVRLSSGATGKLYSQIRHGAPFDLLLAADAERPARLESEDLAVAGSRFTYALGQLVLWSPQADLVDGEGRVLATGDYRHLAIANPRLAPYGRAARQLLQRLGLWDGLQSRLVRGENIGQTFRFVHSGGATLGLVAASQLAALPADRTGSRWTPPAGSYGAIEQQAVLLAERPATRAFWRHLRSEPARALIRDHGYQLPPPAGDR